MFNLVSSSAVSTEGNCTLWVILSRTLVLFCLEGCQLFNNRGWIYRN